MRMYPAVERRTRSEVHGHVFGAAGQLRLRRVRGPITPAKKIMSQFWPDQSLNLPIVAPSWQVCAAIQLCNGGMRVPASMRATSTCRARSLPKTYFIHHLSRRMCRKRERENMNNRMRTGADAANTCPRRGNRKYNRSDNMYFL